MALPIQQEIAAGLVDIFLTMGLAFHPLPPQFPVLF
jgi:hypothetical protein